MPTPLLPTHARTKHKKRSSGGKTILYLIVALFVGYGLFAHFHTKNLSSTGGEKDVQRRKAAEVGQGEGHQEAASISDGQNLRRQDAMRRQEIARAHKHATPKQAEDHGSKHGMPQKQPVPVNQEQLQVQHQPDQQETQHHSQILPPPPHLPTNFFGLSAVDIDGHEVHFSQYSGKVVLVVNVASACGYTDQNYKGLQQLYLKYKERGLEILGFPCNQFGSQEPGDEAHIKDFCTGRYHVTFPMFSKIDVNGAHTHPVYQFLKQQLPVSEGGGGGAGPGTDLAWNFFKFLVNAQGQPVKRFPQNYDAAAVEAAVEALLPASPVQHQQDEAKAPEIHTHSVPSPVDSHPDSGRVPDLARDFYALSATDIDGHEVNFSQYAGKVVLVANVASACGYTDQNYKGLQKTYLKYQDHGLVILGFPCNQFGSQEPGSESEIKDFCTGRYHVTFPMFSKVDVNGPHTHPVYQFLKRHSPTSEGGGGGTGEGTDLGWNFFKFLVDKRGQPVKRFDQLFDAPSLEQEIYKLLHE